MKSAWFSGLVCCGMGVAAIAGDAPKARDVGTKAATVGVVQHQAMPVVLGTLSAEKALMVETGAGFVAAVVRADHSAVDITIFATGKADEAPRELVMPYMGESMMLIDPTTGAITIETIQAPSAGEGGDGRDNRARRPGLCRPAAGGICSSSSAGECSISSCTTTQPDGSFCTVITSCCPGRCGIACIVQYRCYDAQGMLTCEGGTLPPDCPIFDR